MMNSVETNEYTSMGAETLYNQKNAMDQIIYMEDTVEEDGPQSKGKAREIEEMSSLYTQDIYDMPDLDILNEVFANQQQNIPDGPLQRRYMKQVYDTVIYKYFRF